MECVCAGDLRPWLMHSPTSQNLPPPQNSFLSAWLFPLLGSLGPTLLPSLHTCPMTSVTPCLVTSVSGRPWFCYCPLLLAKAGGQNSGSSRSGTHRILEHAASSGATGVITFQLRWQDHGKFGRQLLTMASPDSEHVLPVIEIAVSWEYSAIVLWGL